VVATKGPRLDGQEVVFAHEARHSLMIHQQAAPPEFGRDPSIAIPTSMRKRDLLDLRPYRHLLLQGLRLLQRSIETRPTDRRQLTHTLDTQTALL